MEEEAKTKLREEQDRLTKLIKVIEELDLNEDWKEIKALLLDNLVSKIETKLYQEAISPTIVPENLYKLQGELKWAKRYADLKSYASTLRIELEIVKKRLK